MNTLEYQMIATLKKLKEKYGVFEIKAEFEAEGSRMEEMMRLKDVTSAAGLPIIVKIGGVEAVTDIYNALSIGVKGIVAPMVETPFAMIKYLNMIKTMVAHDNRRDIEFAWNMETKTARKNILDILSLLDINLLSSMTIGRVDLSSSYCINRKDINCHHKITDDCIICFTAAKKNHFKTALGGAIDDNSLPFIKILYSQQLLDKFETRKVVFPASMHDKEGIRTAIEFELQWLQSKQRYYSRIKTEDESRILMLKERLK